MSDDVLDSFLVPSNLPGKRRYRILADGRTLEFEAIANSIVVGTSVYLNGQPMPNGRYTLRDGVNRFEVTGGFVSHAFYVEHFKVQSVSVMVDASRIDGRVVGCEIYTKEGPLPDGVYRLKLFAWVKVTQGKILAQSIFKP